MLADNRQAGQRYVDKITRSEWWRQSCPGGFWEFTDRPPERVWVWLERDENIGAMITHEPTIKDGEELPTMIVGTGIVNNYLPANRDPWVYLHELAHVMSWFAPGHHDKHFNTYFLLLIDRWLGRPQAEALLDECRRAKISFTPGLASGMGID